jgi:DNA-binding MarR family transcriptional regulator
MIETSKNLSNNVESSGSEDLILLLIKNVHFAILRTVDKHIAPLDLTAMQWAPIMAIAKGYAKTAADLANIANIDTGAVTRMLDRLESKGLLIRTRSSDDRRVVNLQLTDEGQRMASEIPAVIHKSMDLHLRSFNSEELATLKNLLKRMLENIPDDD